MPNYKNILFPTDFSTCAGYAKHYAFDLAKRFGAKLHVLHAVDTAYLSYVGIYGHGVVTEPALEQLRTQAETTLEEIAAEAEKAGIKAEIHVAFGKPHAEAVDLAEKHGVELMVVGTHGRSGLDKFFFGSTCEKIIRHASMPVLSIREPGEGAKAPSIDIKRVLCPIDFSQFSRQAAPAAADLCKQFGATLVLTHVVDTRVEYPHFAPELGNIDTEQLKDSASKMLNDIAGQLEGVTTECKVREGVPHGELVTAMDDENIDLLVMATHGHSGVAHVLLGSVAEKVVRSAVCPVLTVRPGAGNGVGYDEEE